MPEPDKDITTDVAIVGLGPGGLAAALEAAYLGKKVVAFSDRAEYVRGQRLILSPSTIDFLKKHSDSSDPEDQLFWRKYTVEKTAQTKDIEKFLYRKLRKYPRVEIVQLQKPEKINTVMNAEDGASSVIGLSDGRKFYTRNILASDGARHDFANLMNQDLHAGIQYGRSPVQERHRYHGVVQLRLKYEACTLLNASRDPNGMEKEALASLLDHKDGCILHQGKLFYFDHKKGSLTEIDDARATQLVEIVQALDPDVGRLASFKEHKTINEVTKRLAPAQKPRTGESTNIARRAIAYMKQGWGQLFEPKCYVFPNADRTKFYFAGEIPKDIFDESDPVKREELLKEWASHAIQHQYGYDVTQLEYKKGSSRPAKDRLQATVFEMEMQVCQQPIVTLAGGVFAQVGDARRTPNYNLGHGLNDAIAGGITFVRTLGSSAAPTFKSDQFVHLMNHMDRRVEMGMSKGLLSREQKKLLASIDKLVDHLKKTPIGMDKETFTALTWARHDIVNTKGLVKLSEAIKVIQPIVDKHQHRDTGIGYRVWRWIASIFSDSATKTKSANLLDDVSDRLGVVRESEQRAARALRR